MQLQAGSVRTAPLQSLMSEYTGKCITQSMQYEKVRMRCVKSTEKSAGRNISLCEIAVIP